MKKGTCTKSASECAYAHPPACRFFPKGECRVGKNCKNAHFKPKHANAGTDSFDDSGGTGDEREGKPSGKAKSKAKRKGKSACIAKALLSIVGASQETVGQSMFYFASVVSLCDDAISYRINAYKECLKSLAEDYEQHQDKSSLFYWELPSYKESRTDALYKSGTDFWRQPAYGILRDKDQPSLSLEVKFPRAIISHAKSREDREMPWEYRWNNNLTGYNPDRVGHKIKRDSLRRHGVKLISWKKYFSKEKADMKLRKEVHKNSEKNARDEALKLE